MKKKLGAIIILLSLIATTLVPFLSARANTDDTFFRELFKKSGSNVSFDFSDTQNTKLRVWVTVKTTAHKLSDDQAIAIQYLKSIFPLTMPWAITDFIGRNMEVDFMFLENPPNLAMNQDNEQFILNITDITTNQTGPGLNEYYDMSEQYTSDNSNQRRTVATNITLIPDHTYRLTAYYNAGCDDLENDAGDTVNICNGTIITKYSNKNTYYPFAEKNFVYNQETIDAVVSEHQSNPSQFQEVTENSSSDMPRCSTGTFTISVSGCVAQLIYYALFVPTSFIFGLSGELLDFAIDYTTDSDSYGGATGSFVNEGWKITRDLANIAFIFILLYTAIGTILNLHGVDWKKTLARVIIIALLINFSLFAAKIVIDAGNILARVFYSSMGVTEDKNSDNLNGVFDSSEKSVSIAIVSKFNPQSLFSQALEQKSTPQGGVQTTSDIDAPSAGWFTIITLIMVLLNLVGIYVFFMVAFLFLARTAGLWILMIFAPIAFISYVIPFNIGGGGGGGAKH